MKQTTSKQIVQIAKALAKAHRLAIEVQRAAIKDSNFKLYGAASRIAQTLVSNENPEDGALRVAEHLTRAYPTETVTK